MSKEMEFFIYLLERYVEYKNMTTKQVIQEWESLHITDFIYNMYEVYHIECIENAFEDIDRIISERREENLGTA